MKLHTPLDREAVRALRCGDRVSLSGVIYTARDAAHLRMTEALARGEDLPFAPEGAVIYYAGPTPARPGNATGSAGPTTSVRMDRYAPALIERGLAGMIGKGDRGDAVVEAMRMHGAVYFGADGGAGALLARHILSAELVAYEELGTEAVRRLTVEAMPLVVVIDSTGENLYRTGRAAYLAARKT